MWLKSTAAGADRQSLETTKSKDVATVHDFLRLLVDLPDCASHHVSAQQPRFSSSHHALMSLSLQDIEGRDSHSDEGPKADQNKPSTAESRLRAVVHPPLSRAAQVRRPRRLSRDRYLYKACLSSCCTACWTNAQFYDFAYFTWWTNGC